MFNVRLLFGLFCLLLTNIFATPVAKAQSSLPSADIFEPNHSGINLGVGYQYQDYHVLGTKFHDNGLNTDLGVHIFDLVTGATFRLVVSAEGTAAMGFGGYTGGRPRLDAKSVFIGGGPRLSIESRSPIIPWLHVLPGYQYFRFTQTATLGSNGAFGFMAGGGLDFRIFPAVYWRVQGDYIGTHYQPSIPALQSNFSIGSGILFYF